MSFTYKLPAGVSEGTRAKEQSEPYHLFSHFTTTYAWVCLKTSGCRLKTHPPEDQTLSTTTPVLSTTDKPTPPSHRELPPPAAHIPSTHLAPLPVLLFHHDKTSNTALPRLINAPTAKHYTFLTLLELIFCLMDINQSKKITKCTS